jgi:signal transduction histidine kinase
VRRLHLRWVPALLLGATLAVEVVAVALSWGLEPRYDTVVYAFYAVTLVGAGSLIVSRYPGHRIGWLFIATALQAALPDLAQGWGVRAAQQHWPAGPFAEWVALWSWMLGGPLLVLTFLLFPDGHLTRRGWATIAWANIAGMALLMPGWALSPDIGNLFVGDRNPYAIDASWRSVLLTAGMPLFLGSLVAAIVPLVQRLRRATGVERLQLRWFAFASMCAAVILPVVALLWSVAPVVRPLSAVALAAMPVGAAVGILRYRLYDIDVVISRTLAYGALSVMLVGTYAASVVAIGAAVGRGSAWSAAGATLAAALVVGSVRRRVQDNVDRRFNRARFDALQQMAFFVDELRSGRAVPEDVERPLRKALGVEDLHLLLLLPESELTVDLAGVSVTDDLDDGQRRWPIRYAGTTLGTLVAPADLAERGSLVPKVLDAAALAVEIARLRVGLRRQLVEVEASRARIVAAGDEERRRIERDLHDGAQQRLVSIGLALRHTQHVLGPDGDPDVNRTLDDAVAEITVAIDELRELAHGLRPAHLDTGLGPALRDLARRAPLPVQVVANGDRYPIEIETAAYFTACEALTNAVKHARATKIELRATRERSRLVVAIVDDGVGGAVAQNGSGLAGLADRVAAHGGSLRIKSDAGQGTTVVAEFPCAS